MSQLAQAFILPTGEQVRAPVTRKSNLLRLVEDPVEPISVAMRDMTLTTAEAEELRRRLEDQTNRPTRPARTVPLGDPSFLRSGG